ncbi:MAG: hypothetical protein CM15mP102_08440 [Flavobacteriales bacterium]|nr:MAG: hypothetical protein CM15mP102_08440 [Flavobacteriales bacterium]
MANKRRIINLKLNILVLCLNSLFYFKYWAFRGDNGIQNIQQTDISSFENYLRMEILRKLQLLIRDMQGLHLMKMHSRRTYIECKV